MEKKLTIILVTVGLVLIALFYQTVVNRLLINDINSALTNIDNHLSGTPKLNKKFNYVHSTFKLYNPEIDTSTVNTFLRVTAHFELAENDTVFNWLVGQLCLESGAKQFYLSSDRKAGKVIRGTSGEVGIAQIIPSTAIDYLSKFVSDPKELYALGATDFSFINVSKGNTTNVITWLSNPTNNLVLWGLMTRDNMVKHGVIRGLVAYNIGVGGMEKFVACNLAIEHSYIKNLVSTLTHIAETKGWTLINVPSGMHVTQTELR